jgi:hypothetical protein
MARPDGKKLSTFGTRPFTVALEVRADQTFRLRWYVVRTKHRLTLPNLKYLKPDGTVCLDDVSRAEGIALRATQLLREGRSPRDVLKPDATAETVAKLATSVRVVATEFLDREGVRISTDATVSVRNEDGSVGVLDQNQAEQFALRASQTQRDVSEPRVVDERADATPKAVTIWPTSVGVLSTMFLDRNCGGITTDSVVNYRSLLEDICTVLGDEFDLEMLNEDSDERLVRGLAKLWLQRQDLHGVSPEHLRGEPDLAKFIASEVRRGGAVAAEKSISLAYRLARWANRQDKLRPPSMLENDWRDRVANHWANAVAGPRHVVDRPRHDIDEARSVIGCREKADKRLKLWFSTAYGTRGQIRRVMRTHVDLAPDIATQGRFFIPGGSRKKPGSWIDLDARGVAEFELAFCTWLARFELAYREGRLRNYPIFPEGDLEWSDVPDDALGTIRPISESFLGELYDSWEVAAGVRKVAGRRWYGHRRLFKTLTMKHETDRSVLDRLMGHHTGGTGAIYEDHEDPRVRKRAMEVRELVWKDLT